MPSSRQVGSSVKRASRRMSRQAAARLTWLVAGLLGALLILLWATPGDLPLRWGPSELLWASSRRPIISAIMGLLLTAGGLTVAAGLARGRHRAWLLVAWVAFLSLAIPYHGRRLETIARVIAQVYGPG